MRKSTARRFHFLVLHAHRPTTLLAPPNTKRRRSIQRRRVRRWHSRRSGAPSPPKKDAQRGSCAPGRDASSSLAFLAREVQHKRSCAGVRLAWGGRFRPGWMFPGRARPRGLMMSLIFPLAEEESPPSSPCSPATWEINLLSSRCLSGLKRLQKRILAPRLKWPPGAGGGRRGADGARDRTPPEDE